MRIWAGEGVFRAQSRDHPLRMDSEFAAARAVPKLEGLIAMSQCSKEPQNVTQNGTVLTECEGPRLIPG